MKSLVIMLFAIFATVTSFVQKAKGNPDTTIKFHLAYGCPMHPQYVSNAPAKCPVCGDNMNQLSQKEMHKIRQMPEMWYGNDGAECKRQSEEQLINNKRREIFPVLISILIQ